MQCFGGVFKGDCVKKILCINCNSLQVFDYSTVMPPRVFGMQRGKEPCVHSLPTCYASHRKTAYVMLRFTIKGKKNLRKESQRNGSYTERSQVLNSKLTSLFWDASNSAVKP